MAADDINPAGALPIARLATRGPAASSRAAVAGTLALVALATVRCSHPAPACSAATIGPMLSRAPRPPLRAVDMRIALVTTPVKRAGVLGWTATGCSAAGTGRLVRAAQHSSDGFWTADVALESLSIDGAAVSTAGRFLRLEIRPGTDAHAEADAHPARAGERFRFSGPLLIDRDDDFFEVHPLRIERTAQ